jgi:hypothetical protein
LLRAGAAVFEPRNENRSVPVRPANAELRTREYLTLKEVDRLIKTTRAGRYGHRDATLMNICVTTVTPAIGKEQL